MNAPAESSSQSDGKHAATAPAGALESSSGKTDALLSWRESSSTNANILARVVADLMRGPQSRQDLEDRTGASKNAIRHAVTTLYDAGVIYIHRKLRVGERGKPRQVFAMNRTPFECADATQITVQ